MNQQAQQIANLLMETSHAHHQAFLATDGLDPEWPIWYADYLHEKLTPLMATAVTKSVLIYLLVHLEKKYSSETNDEEWTNYYGRTPVRYDG